MAVALEVERRKPPAGYGDLQRILSKSPGTPGSLMELERLAFRAPDLVTRLAKFLRVHPDKARAVWVHFPGSIHKVHPDPPWLIEYYLENLVTIGDAHPDFRSRAAQKRARDFDGSTEEWDAILEKEHYAGYLAQQGWPALPSPGRTHRRTLVDRVATIAAALDDQRLELLSKAAGFFLESQLTVPWIPQIEPARTKPRRQQRGQPKIGAKVSSIHAGLGASPPLPAGRPLR